MFGHKIKLWIYMEDLFHVTEPLSIPTLCFLASAFPRKGPWLLRDPRGSPAYDGKIGNIIYIYIFFCFFFKKRERNIFKEKNRRKSTN